MNLLRLASAWTLVGAGLAALAGCVSTVNFVDPVGPRYAGAPGRPAAAPRDTARFHVATFNVENGQNPIGAVDVIRAHEDLSSADVILLQEMDGGSTRFMAEELGMAWVYYPAGLKDGREVGNAVLSRWPITSDAKLILPHRSVIGGTQRIATAATLDVAGLPVRVYSVHLATPVNQARDAREDQMGAVLDDAAPFQHVVIGGDLNSAAIAELGLRAGFHWPTRDGPRTTWLARVDHILIKGSSHSESWIAGTVVDQGDVSDHRPVWAKGVFP